MRLHLIRHGKTEAIREGQRDFDRELVPRGIAQSEAIGHLINGSQNLKIYCSSAVRTRQTFKSIASIATLSEACYLEDLYLCSKETFLDLIWQEKSECELLFVGHNFGISDLLSYFTGERYIMRTGEYMVLEFDCPSWAECSRDMARIALQFRSEVR